MNSRLLSHDHRLAATGGRTLERDIIPGTPGGETLSGGPVSDTISGGDGDDILYGNEGADILNGDGGVDILLGGIDNDTLNGGAGDDVLEGGLGADALSGGDGLDSASYAFTTAGVSVSLANPGANTGAAVGDTFSSVENLIGSDFADLLIGDGGGNSILGGAGADRLEGGGGDDNLDGEAGGDLFLGGDGFDTVVYRTAPGGVVASLIAGGGADGDQFSSIEALIGGVFGDTLVGGSSGNVLDGAGGADFLDGEADSDILLGGEGTDVLIGGLGNDLLTGGSGADTFVYSSSADSDGVASIDTITDFESGVDRIDMEAFAPTRLTASLVDGVTTLTAYNADGEQLQIRVNGVVTREDIGGADRTLTGTPNVDVLVGRLGDDRITGLRDSDTLTGGPGSDTFVYLSTRDSQLQYGVDFISDFATGVDRIDLLALGPVRARIVLGGEDTVVYVATPSDPNMQIRVAAAVNIDDMLVAAGSVVSVFGSSDAETISGSANGDRILGGGGQDLIEGRAGDDTIIAGNGGLNGGEGDDIISAEGPGVAIADGGFGDDELTGGAGDFVTGGNGDDTLFGYGGAVLDGGFGDDRITSLGVDDVLIGGAGDDVLEGLSSAMDGGSGADTITGFRSIVLGGSGADRLYVFGGAGDGGSDADTMFVYEGGVATGGDGADTIYAIGARQVFGDAGDDLVYVQSVGAFDGGDGTDTLVLPGGDVSFYSFAVSEAGLDFSLGGRLLARVRNFERVSLDGGQTSITVEDFQRQIFDAYAYLVANPDVYAATGLDVTAALNHYFTNGAQEARDLGDFDAYHYLASNPDLIQAFGADRAAATQHYIQNGLGEDRGVRTFDALLYTASNRDLAEAFGTNEQAAIRHYVTNGFAEGRSVDAFDPIAFLAANPGYISGFAADPRSAVFAYLETIDLASTEFDNLGYVASNPDLIAGLGLKAYAAAEHYVRFGYAEGRSTDAFDGLAYTASSLDLARAIGFDEQAAARHYIVNGFAEGRPTSGFDQVAYALTYADLREAIGLNDRFGLLSHWLDSGADEGRVGDAAFGREQSGHDLGAAAIDTAFDRDWFASEQTGVISLDFDLQGLSTGSVAVYDSQGRLLTQALDVTSDTNLLFLSRGSSAGRSAYYVVVNGGAASEGTYAVSASAVSNPPGFDPDDYMAANGDLAAAFQGDADQALYHYLRYGLAENRATEGFDAVAYLLTYSDLAGRYESGALAHWVTSGAREGRAGDVMFGREQSDHELVFSAAGTIDSASDVDWFETSVGSQRRVTVGVAGADLGDSAVAVYDLSGRLIAFDEGFGTGGGSQVTFETGNTSGDFYVVVRGVAGATGGYTVNVNSVSIEPTVVRPLEGGTNEPWFLDYGRLPFNVRFDVISFGGFSGESVAANPTLLSDMAKLEDDLAAWSAPTDHPWGLDLIS